MTAAIFTRFDRLMAAVTFAEENEHSTAREFLRKDENIDIRLTNRPEQPNRRNKPVAALILTGIVSAGLYFALLSNQDYLNDNFGKGGTFAFLPIITAFIFSFFHGTFTGHFWTMLGVEASKKKKEVK